ncbi:PAS domain S-box-containing protein/diguanylate cyclase (GGDEF) domain-containing protein [Alkalispirochaeta americana]|uniref:PAS domain S-box-containing protein/diguanylate cyclase (GGDEF) domain-containing protein n=1 Tax=Alkalispirochaeta americana TaxID=159291 RepID=A0A1N6NY70_9SPIO|nr:EAL domain-containing protein [Alkalispirochaeta americana]SIP96957.1 PAS domain S-box-containing protein/diguanylate cyclase (GGDEF) domain-containing protein [Alkalispirochaeta americana]
MVSRRVLIVEDEKIIALDLQRRLEKFGYRVVALCATADEAVAQALEHCPDIILMDIMLGGDRDGIDAAIEIKERQSTPIVFLTAYADDNTVARAKKAEPVGYVLKPFKERELRTTIDIALYKADVDRKLQEQEQLFETIFDTMNDGLIAVGADQTIRFLNPVARDLTGVFDQDVTGLPLQEVFSLFDDHSQISANIPFTSVLSGDTFTFENLYLETEQGGRVDIAGSISPIKTNYGTDGALVTFRDITSLRKMSQVIEYQASHDTLTGLMNRDEFFSRLKQVAEAARDASLQHTLIYLDLDQFKIVNDVCGHQAGDELLRQVSSDVKGIVASEEHLLARLGGDEFGILLINTDIARAMTTANAILTSLNRKFIWQKHAFHVTASIGIVPVRGTNADVYNILAAADDASYLAKEEGGNIIKVYEMEDYTFLKRRGEMQWISRLNHALDDDKFELWGQPIVSTNGTVRDHQEVLIRMIDTDGRLISPSDFIPAAEKYNLMPAVDRWVLAKALDLLAAMHKAGRNPLFSINVSGASLADESFLDYAEELISTHSIQGSQICLEITETAAIANLSRATAFMRRLKNLGVTFALDDFGNGFSSFSYLKTLPVDYLKIDGSFVKDIADDLIDRALVVAVNDIGHVMNMQTIAEFVKDNETRVLLEEIGVDYLQGYEIAKPAPFAMP